MLHWDHNDLRTDVGKGCGAFPRVRAIVMLAGRERLHKDSCVTDAFDLTGDPVANLIVAGRASTVDEAEELYLDEHLHELVALVESDLDDDQFRAHPLVELLLARGSRRWEDSLA